MYRRHLFVWLLLCFGLVPVRAQSSRAYLKQELDDLVSRLTEKQLVRLLRYGEHLMDEVSGAGDRPAPAPAVIIWDAYKFDFGRVNASESLYIPFKFLWLNGPPYQVTDVKSSCNCVSLVHFDPPGHYRSKGEILLHIKPKQLAGPQTITVVLLDNSDSQGKSVLFIDMDVVKDKAPQDMK